MVYHQVPPLMDGSDRTSLSFQAISDRELWVVKGRDWSIPIYAVMAERKGEEGGKALVIRAAVALSPIQNTALDNALALPQYTTPSGAIWVGEDEFELSDLSRMAEKAPGVTPAYYFKWGETAAAEPPASTFTAVQVPTAPKPAATSDMQAFIKRIWERTNLADPKLLSFFYDAICNEAQRWLLEECKTLDLGFVKLAALPYRSNWKQILLAKFPKIIRFFKMSKEKRDAQLALTDYVVEIRNTDLWAIHPQLNYFHWTIEATPTRTWNQYVENREKDRLTKLSRGQYSRAWARLITQLEARITETFGHFVLQTAIPCGAVPASSYFGNQIVGPHVPRSHVRPISPDHTKTHVALPDPADPPEEINDGEPQIVALEADLLPRKVPVVQFGVQDMRDSGGSNMGQAETES